MVCNQLFDTKIWVFPKIGGNPQIIHFHRVFHYKPSILGYPILGNIHIQLCFEILGADVKPHLNATCGVAKPDLRPLRKTSCCRRAVCRMSPNFHAGSFNHHRPGGCGYQQGFAMLCYFNLCTFVKLMVLIEKSEVSSTIFLVKFSVWMDRRHV